jgi:DNA-binding transcriptional LysR family regulator
MDTLVATTRATGRGETGRLAIGFCTSLTTGNLRATMLDFKKQFPQVELGTVEQSRTRLTTALRNGAIDVHVTTGDWRLSTVKSCRFGASEFGRSAEGPSLSCARRDLLDGFAAAKHGQIGLVKQSLPRSSGRSASP